MQIMPSNDPSERQNSYEEHARASRRIIRAEVAK